MWTFPILIDSRPSFLSPDDGGSLLLSPLGTTSVLRELRCRLHGITGAPPVVMTTFGIGPAYESAIREECPDVVAVEPISSFKRRCHTYEASDALLLADPACLPRDPREPALVRLGEAEDPRWVRHLVALEQAGGTREYIASDDSGRVQAIQRYYDSVTWSFAFGISCSLIPVACLQAASLPSLVSLPHLRRQLTSLGVPSRDLPLERGALNLGTERGLLAANERHVLDLARGASHSSRRNAPVHAAPGAEVHTSATLLGPVVLQSGARVEPEATIVGPAVVGAGARIGAGATVAQSVVGRGQVLGKRAVVRHRVVARRSGAGEEMADSAAAHSPEAWEAPFEVRPVGPPPRRVEPLLKRAFDVVASAFGLAVLSPVCLLIAGVVKLDSRGPVHFGHKREGFGGRALHCWKFRTMVQDADQKQHQLAGVNELDGPQFKMERDPRRTRFGRFLTSTNLDELPQLWNVLLGEMSLVGPRPSPFRENQLCVPWREARLSVRPGITGLWQVCRHDRHKGDFHQWIYYDLLYVQHQSFWLDMKILLATVVSMLRKGKSVPLSWLLPASAYGERRAAPRGSEQASRRTGEPSSPSPSLVSADQAHRSGSG